MGIELKPLVLDGVNIVPPIDNVFYLGSATVGFAGIHFGTNVMLKGGALVVTVRNSADSSAADLSCRNLLASATIDCIRPSGDILFQADKAIKARASNAGFVPFQGRGSGSHVEHARLAPNHWNLVNGRVLGTTGLEFSDVTDGVKVIGFKTVKVTKAHGSDLFDASALTDNVTIWQQPANSILIAAKMRTETQFAGVATLKVELGLAGDEDGLVVSGGMDLIADPGDTEYHTRGAYWDETAAMGFYFTDAAVDWKAYATSTVQNLDQTSTGSIDFYFTYLEL